MRCVDLPTILASCLWTFAQGNSRVGLGDAGRHEDHRFTRAIGTFSLLAALCGSAFALDPKQPLSQVYHTSWTARDGLIGSVQSLAQTTDGYMWIGTSDGLYRFDGVSFERYKPELGALLSGAVSALLADSDGGLWIGYVDGNVSLLKDGRLSTYTHNSLTWEAGGLPVGSIKCFAQTPDGSIWVGAVGGFARLERGTWHRFGLEWPYAGKQALALFVSREGTLWAATEDGIRFLPMGARVFEDSEIHAQYVNTIAQAPDGTMWYEESFGRSLKAFRSPGSQPLRLAPATDIPASQLYFDREGALWFAGEGLSRISSAEKLFDIKVVKSADILQKFSLRNGLSDVYGKKILEDREGNIWVGTDGGLDRFRHRNVTFFPMEPGTHNYGLVVGAHNDVWAWPWSFNGRARRGVRVQDGKFVNGGPDSLHFGYHNPDGTMLLANQDSLWHWDGKHFSQVAGPMPHTNVTAVARDAAGTLWISEMQGGIFSQTTDRGWVHADVLKGQPTSKADSMFADRAGRVWFAYSNVIALLNHGETTTYVADSSAPIGRFRVITGCEQQVWVSGSSGLAFFQGGRFHELIQAEGHSFGPVGDFVATCSSGLWLSIGQSVVHIPEEEIRLALENVTHRVSYETLDLVSDLPESLQPKSAEHDVVQTKDGLLWFATHNGVVRIDPAYISRNPLPPPVSVRSVVADATPYSAYSDARLPALTRDIQFEYAGLSLSIPERVRFRYKLEGRDMDWQDAGTRRQAFYTNLGPGSYHFHVIACNNDGLWNETGATWNFVIAPAFYQTWWFRSLYLAFAALVLWVFYLLRLRQATAKLQERLLARLEERERIARELHDTLLQGFQGLMLRLQAVLKTLPAKEPAHLMIEKVLDRADEVLLEGRQSVRDLREEGARGDELSDELGMYATELAEGSSAVFKLSVLGTSQVLSPIVFGETRRIAREALSNAFQHSKASRIEAEVTYQSAGVCLRIRDNGIGIDERTRGSGRPGHWGLIGMRERAERMGGKLNIRSSPGDGTEVELTVPGKVAYTPKRSESRWRRIKYPDD